VPPAPPRCFTIERYVHLVGGRWMAADAKGGVVDANLRTFAVPNLLITDGSVLPTQGSANPALTIMAVVDRAAALLAARRAPSSGAAKARASEHPVRARRSDHGYQ
jgi:choline dehydrogenase-like flavoprotein